MAGVAKAKKSVLPPRKPGRPAKVTKRAPAPPSAPKVSKDELRARVVTLEQRLASLRAKSREANKLAKAAAARIAELEAEVARLAATPPKPSKPARAKRQHREIDPGDAVPPGVAVEEAAPLDAEAETALENLEEHLGHG